MANRIVDFTAPQSHEGAWWPTQLQSQTEGMQQQVNSFLTQGARWVSEHPEMALTSAVVTGMVLGWFIKRR